MDDFLNKPVTPQTLRATLLRNIEEVAVGDEQREYPAAG